MDVLVVFFCVIMFLSDTIGRLISSGKFDEESESNFRNRSGRFWGIGIVRFENSVCLGADGLDGTCYTRRQCAQIENGVVSGRCASNIGVCCVVQANCGDKSAFNNTYFVNPNFPSAYPGGATCTLTIQKCHPGIFQVRIDFLSLTLAQPDGNGHCIYDALNIIGGGSIIRPICGDNSGQHIYVNFNGDEDIQLIINTDTSVTLGRMWNLKILQIDCNCPTRAPSGCLLYYTDLSGTVTSFNYGQTVSSALVVVNTTSGKTRPGTRELANLNYGICVGMTPGYCSIEWSQSSGDPYSFTVSDDTIALSVNSSLQSGGTRGSQCRTDFIVVPNAYSNKKPANSDRFCGNQLPTITSSAKPFVLTVVTDGGEVYKDDTFDTGNRGFSLDYTQKRCSSTLILS